MTGLITRKHAYLHAWTILRGFGVRAWIRLAIGRYATALEALCQ
jgi:hypothetical protein